MLKVEIVNQAYQQIRISGLTTQAVPEEITIALAELDQFMSEWISIGRDVNYHFPTRQDVNHEVISDPNEQAGVYPWALRGVIAYLAKSMVEYFGKEVPPSLAAKSRSGLTVIKSKTVKLNPQQYPNSMPIGSGNRWRQVGNLRRFYTPNYRGRDEPYNIIVNQILDLTADFTRDLQDGETVDSYVIAADPNGGVVLLSDSLANNVVSYRVEATGGSNAEYRGNRDGRVTMTATTDQGLTLPRAYCFNTQDNTCVVTQA